MNVELTRPQINTLLEAARKILDEAEAYGHSPAAWNDDDMSDLASAYQSLTDQALQDGTPA